MNRLLRWLRRDPVPESDPTVSRGYEDPEEDWFAILDGADPWTEALADPGFKDRLRAASDRMDRQGRVVRLEAALNGLAVTTNDMMTKERTDALVTAVMDALAVAEPLLCDPESPQ